MTNIVMLVRNRLRLTEQAIQTLFNNTSRDQFNLTLVDDSSDDFRVTKRLHELAIRPNVTYLRIEKSGHVLARTKNLGVFWARQTFGCGDWLYLSDNDVAFLPGWLERMTKTAEVAELAGFRLFGGQVHPFHQPIGEVQRWEDMGISEHLVLDGPSWLMRWKTWRSVGEFRPDHAPGPCQSEDVEWCSRLTKSGGRIGVVHPHCVIHTGLTQTDGRDAPGRDAREAGRIEGILYE